MLAVAIGSHRRFQHAWTGVEISVEIKAAENPPEIVTLHVCDFCVVSQMGLALILL
jgi:hypothetical protein